VTLQLTLLPGRYAVLRLPADAAVPAWCEGAFTSVTRTRDELSIVAPEAGIPDDGDLLAERGFRVLKVEGPLPFEAVGILASLAAPLAEAKISILAIGTFDTDYVLVREADLPGALAALAAAGFDVPR
jgi:hypothetical protein